MVCVCFWQYTQQEINEYMVDGLIDGGRKEKNELVFPLGDHTQNV